MSESVEYHEKNFVCIHRLKKWEIFLIKMVLLIIEKGRMDKLPFSKYKKEALTFSFYNGNTRMSNLKIRKSTKENLIIFG